MALCDQCVLHHFGQQYQPHPVILPQITEIIVGLTAASEMGMGKEPSDELLALLYKATNILKRISK